MLAAEPKALPKLQKPTSLLSPQLDFWLLGGASLVTWLFLAISGRFERVAGMGDLTMNLPMTISFVQILVNYPHFMASYHLCYRRGFAFLRRHWIQTLAVPAVLIAYMTYLGSLATDPTRNLQFRHGLSALVMVMYFTVGWHYTKQAFGCVMAYANYSGYRMDGMQRESIRYAILSVWWYKFCYDSQVGMFTFSDLSGEKWPVLPDYTRVATFLIFLVLQVYPISIWSYLTWPFWSGPCLNCSSIRFAWRSFPSSTRSSTWHLSIASRCQRISADTTGRFFQACWHWD